MNHRRESVIFDLWVIFDLCIIFKVKNKANAFLLN